MIFSCINNCEHSQSIQSVFKSLKPSFAYIYVSLINIAHFKVDEVKNCTYRFIYYIHSFAVDDFWIGGKWNNGTYKWFTSDGQTIDMKYTPYVHETPSYKNMCVELWEYFQYELFSYHCDSKFNFICKLYFWQHATYYLWNFLNCKLNSNLKWWSSEKCC